MPRVIWTIAISLALAFIVNQGLQQQTAGANKAQEIAYSDFLTEVDAGRIQSVKIQGDQLNAVRDDGSSVKTINPADSGLVGDLIEHKVKFAAVPPHEPNLLLQILVSWFPMLLMIGVWVYFARKGAGGGGAGGVFGFGKSKARRMEPNQVKVTLADVAGVDEAREEVGEIVAFLREPAKFARVGGKVPRGVLMVGPPGTGKTLLARAIAGEAKVPFFSISGSDFVEMFVGVGAARVRDLFLQAKQAAPAIIFIDEIDAVGRRRGAGIGGGNDEREQTLNQMLVEMDGFAGDEGVIVIAATNRPDVLDPALLRPGRFDRTVTVSLPDIRGREQILHVHMRKVPLATDVEVGVVARGTPGFSGADLENLVNEAALTAARTGHEKVQMIDFERAKDKIMMGAERRGLVMSEAEKKLTAFHEAGHTIVGRLVPEHDPVHKVSIIPRGRALGVTLFLPEGDRYSATKTRLESQLSSLFGGRVAEELVFGRESVTTGASNDIERASKIARNMVVQWGLSEKLGPLSFDDGDQETFLGGGMARRPSMSEETARLIDLEVHAIIERNYRRATELLTANLDKLHLMAEALVKYETLDAQQIDDIMMGKPPRPPYNPGSGSEPPYSSATPESQPPVRPGPVTTKPAGNPV